MYTANFKLLAANGQELIRNMETTVPCKPKAACASVSEMPFLGDY